jgi:CHU_C Type IX secretion signal domain
LRLGIVISLVFSLLCQYSFASSPSYLFIKNKGQWPQEVLFRTQIPNGYLWLTENGLKYQFLDQKNGTKHGYYSDPSAKKSAIIEHNISLNFGLKTKTTNLTQKSKIIQTYNFFLGKNPEYWQSDVPAFEEILLENVFTGIDFRMYAIDQTLKYEYIVKPGADPRQISFEYKGADKVRLENGALIVETQAGILKEFAPFTFQNINKARKKIQSSFEKNGEIISFNIENFDKSKELIIDPELIFSTYTGAFSDNWAHTSTFDSEGNLYAGGTVFGTNYPISLGVIQPKVGGVTTDTDTGNRTDIVITKYASDGKTVLYSTFLGGEESEVPHSLIVNSKDQLVVFGTTSSSNFPVTEISFDRTFNGGQLINGPPVSSDIAFYSGTDIFISLIEKNGSRLLASTYLGGSDNDGIHDYRALAIKNYGDEFRGEVYIDKTDNIYIASVTKSANFPQKDAFQTKKSVYDAIVCKLSPNLNSLLFSTFLGGTDYDAAYGIRVDNQGAIYVCGTTLSKDIFSSAVGLNKSILGESDAFVVKIEANKISAATFLGTSKSEVGSLMDLDEAGNVYVFGLSTGAYAVSNGVYSNAKSGQFIQALSPNLANNNFSTVLGTGSGAVDLVPTAFMVNKCGNIYFSGWGGKTNTKNGFSAKSTTKGMPVTENAFRKTTTGSNYYFGILEKNAKSLLFGTFFGSEAPPNANDERGDHLDGGTCRFDKKGVIYHTACVCKAVGNFVQFPIKNAAQANHNSGNCNMAAFKFDLDALLAKFDIKEGNTINPTSLCAPVKLEFANNSLGAEEYEWFIDGDKVSTTRNIGYTIENAGEYTIKLKIKNKLTCKEVDSTFRKLITKKFDFTVSKDTLVCPNGLVKLKATGGKSYLWSPANLFTSPTDDAVSFKPSSSGVVSVKITNEECSITKEINVKAENNKPDFNSSPSKTICAGDSIILKVGGSADAFIWRGPGIIDSTAKEVKLKPSKTSTYTVSGIYPDGCKPSNSIKITLDESVKLDFSPDYIFACNSPTKIKIQNKSQNGDTYKWLAEGLFNTIGESPAPFILQNTKQVPIVLESKSKDGCLFTLRKTLDLSAFDGLIPNVITPNNDKKNDTFVVGYPPGAIDIYSAWGKKVFTSLEYFNDWGTKAETGTYYYMLSIPKGPTCKGFVEVLRK